MEKELKQEITAMIADALEPIQKENAKLKEAVKDLQEKVEFAEEEISDLQKSAGSAPASKTKLKPNPKFKPEYSDKAKVRVKALEGSHAHKTGEEFDVMGHQATVLIQKGYAELVKVVLEPKEKK